MEIERWNQIEALFEAARQHPPDRRAEFLRQGCPGDPELRAEVESLLKAADTDDPLLDGSPLSSLAEREPALKPGDRLGNFQIVALAGRGGMGEVYRARDLRLKREVAIKTLPAVFAGDGGRVARFEREARAASALNHPNIVSVYDIGREDGTYWIATELVTGESLASAIERGPLGVPRSLEIASQIADGLAAAHAAGIVHRDLKPANVMLARDGRVKILDFGLALRRRAPQHSSTLELTNEGTVVGTAGYMSPEQVRGEQVDHRSDLFNMGAVLYEMLGGKRAFAGRSSVEVMHAILKEDPGDLPASVPPVCDRIVRRCLQKDRERRFQSAADLGFAIQSWSLSPQVRPRSPHASRAWIAATVVVGTLLTVLSAVHFRERPPQLPAVQFSIFPPAGVKFGDVRYQGPPLISPDGSQLAFGGIDEHGVHQLWVRPLRSLTARPLGGTEGGFYPFWSPDSRWLGFLLGNKLMKIPIDGGSPQTLTNAGCCGGTWARTEVGTGTIVFAGDGLRRIPADGGEPIRITMIDPSHNEVSHRHPQFLPDGRHVLFLAVDEQGDDTVCTADVQSKPDPRNVRRLNLHGTSHVWWAAPGYLLFLKDSNLMAQAFDAQRFELSGEPFLVAEHVGDGFNRLSSDFSISSNGVLAWRSGFDNRRQLSWFERGGSPIAGFNSREPYLSPSLAPDGIQIAFIRPDTPVEASSRPVVLPRNSIWTIDSSRGTIAPFASGPAVAPVWSPDGRRIAFGRSEKGRYGLYSKSVAGGDEELLLRTDSLTVPASWSHDGRSLLFYELLPGKDVFVLPMVGERKPILLSHKTLACELSSDDRWIACAVGGSGHYEIWVRPFAAGSQANEDKWQVSSDIGLFARWRGDGRELFYYAPDFGIMSVNVETRGKFHSGTPKLLFNPHDVDPTNFDFEVSADGQRFLVSRITEDDGRPVNISLNWLAGLKK